MVSHASLASTARSAGDREQGGEGEGATHRDSPRIDAGASAASMAEAQATTVGFGRAAHADAIGSFVMPRSSQDGEALCYQCKRVPAVTRCAVAPGNYQRVCATCQDALVGHMAARLERQDEEGEGEGDGTSRSADDDPSADDAPRTGDDRVTSGGQGEGAVRVELLNTTIKGQGEGHGGAEEHPETAKPAEAAPAPAPAPAPKPKPVYPLK